MFHFSVLFLRSQIAIKLYQYIQILKEVLLNNYILIGRSYINHMNIIKLNRHTMKCHRIHTVSLNLYVGDYHK